LPGRQLTGRVSVQLGTLNNTSGSTRPVNYQGSCDWEYNDQAVVHGQWSAMDCNSIITLCLFTVVVNVDITGCIEFIQ
jgi:hypothetical protein